MSLWTRSRAVPGPCSVASLWRQVRLFCWVCSPSPIDQVWAVYLVLL